MGVRADPVVVEKLAAFARRRQRRIVGRGISAGLATLLAVMMVISLVDWLAVVPDGVRLAMSMVGYGGVVAVVWITCLRMALHIPHPREVARLIEHVQPDLHEDLLSAVELGDPKSDP